MQFIFDIFQNEWIVNIESLKSYIIFNIIFLNSISEILPRFYSRYKFIDITYFNVYENTIN